MASKSISEQKTARNPFVLPVIIAVTILGGFYIFTVYDLGIVPIAIPIVLGILLENMRLSDDWGEILIVIIVAFFFSLIHFIPLGDNTFSENLETYPYTLIGFYIFISATNYQGKVAPQLAEGMTLLLSASLVYWVFDWGFEDLDPFFYMLYGIAFLFCIYTLRHAFSYDKHTKKSRLWMSIWSTIIMLIFAVDNVYRSFSGMVDVGDTIRELFTYYLQFVLVGVTLIYVFHHAMMLLVYLPDRTLKYSDDRKELIKETNEQHLERYSSEQISIMAAIIVLCVFTGAYYLNYSYNWLPRHTMIWLMLWMFPLVMNFRVVRSRIDV